MSKKPPTDDQQAAREKESVKTLLHLAGKGNQKARDALVKKNDEKGKK